MKIVAKLVVSIFTIPLLVCACNTYEVRENVALKLNKEPKRSPSPLLPKNELQLSAKYIARSMYETVISHFVPIDGQILVASKTVALLDPKLTIDFPQLLRNDFQERNKPNGIVI